MDSPGLYIGKKLFASICQLVSAVSGVGDEGCLPGVTGGPREA